MLARRLLVGSGGGSFSPPTQASVFELSASTGGWHGFGAQGFYDLPA